MSGRDGDDIEYERELLTGYLASRLYQQDLPALPDELEHLPRYGQYDGQIVWSEADDTFFQWVSDDVQWKALPADNSQRHVRKLVELRTEIAATLEGDIDAYSKMQVHEICRRLRQAEGRLRALRRPGRVS